MRINCKFREKLGRYSAKLLKTMYPKFESIKNPYVLSGMLKNIKHWRTTEEKYGNALCDKLLAFPQLHPQDSFEIFKYGIRTFQDSYSQKTLENWEKFGFFISENEKNSVISLAETNENKIFYKTIEKSFDLNWRNKKYEEYLNSSDVDYCEISSDSQTIAIEFKNKSLVFYGLTSSEDSFADLTSLVEKVKIDNICLPLQSKTPEMPPEKMREFLKNHLLDNENFKLIDVHQLVMKKDFGLKKVDFPLSLALRKPLANFTFFYPGIEKIMEMCEDPFEIEDLVSASTMSEYIRVFNDFNENGCFLCSEHKVFPMSYHEQAILAAPFLPVLIQYMGALLSQTISASSGNFLILCPNRLLFPLVNSVIHPHFPITSPISHSAEGEMLLNTFYNTSQ